MKPSLFLDTNVLLDHLVPQRRKDPCSAIFEMAGKGVFEVHISTQSIVDMVYTAKRLNVTREQTNKFISWMLNHTNVDSFNAFSLRDAIADEDPDFEDSAQLSLAEAAGCDVFVTSDRALLRRQPPSCMLILSPEDLLAKMTKG